MHAANMRQIGRDYRKMGNRFERLKSGNLVWYISLTLLLDIGHIYWEYGIITMKSLEKRQMNSEFFLCLKNRIKGNKLPVCAYWQNVNIDDQHINNLSEAVQLVNNIWPSDRPDDMSRTVP